MNKHDFITIEESKDMLIGKPGTAERDAYEEDIKLYVIGAAIRETRKQQNLTQEELGQMVGVQKAQISRIENGKELKALELPGLWNGAMSDWNTIFVEVPLSTFNPVKTVNDLLRDQHQ